MTGNVETFRTDSGAIGAHRGGRAGGALAVLATVVLAAGCGTEDAVPTDQLAPAAVEELNTLLADRADDQAGGMLAWIDRPGGQSVLAEDVPAAQAFRIGSVTKLFTATVVLQLVEEGALGLDNRLPAVVPAHADRFEWGAEITIRQLLGHTAGLGNLNNRPAFIEDFLAGVEVVGGVATNECVSKQDRDSLGYASREGEFPPGTDWAYSNTGYIVLGEVIEAVTGVALQDAYRERILHPLGLEHTWLACDEPPRAELAHGYLEPGDGPFPAQGADVVDVTGLTFSDAWSAGGMISTAADLAGFGRALFTGALFTQAATLDTLLEPTSGNPDSALGAEIRGDTYGKAGDIFGYSTQLSYDPTTDIVVVVAATNDSADVVSVDSEIRSILGRHGQPDHSSPTS